MLFREKRTERHCNFKIVLTGLRIDMDVTFMLILICSIQYVSTLIAQSCNHFQKLGTDVAGQLTNNSIDISKCTCSTEVCIRKCCQEYEILTREGGKCVKTENFQNILQLPTRGNFVNFESISNSDVQTLHGFTCKQLIFLHPETDKEDDFFIMPNGTLYNENIGSLNASQYCLEFLNDSKLVVPAICPPIVENEEPMIKIFSKVRCLGFLTSSIFLIFTFVGYLIIEELRNLPGKIVLCHTFCLIVGDIFYVIIHTEFNYIARMCEISAFVVHFSFLASFFWLNIMCFDLWWTFSGYRSFNGSPKERDFKKFLVYCFYAWGCPIVITFVTLMMEFCPIIPDNYIKPNFGKSKCWFESKEALFWYFYSFISAILIINFWMFIRTVLIVLKHRKEAKVLKRSGSRRHNEHDQQRFHLYLKLFIVMGVNWLMEVISYYVEGPQYLWILTDAGNTLQGVMIFLIFVCNKRVLLLLNKKLYPKKIFIANNLKSNNSRCTSLSSINLTKINSKNSFQMKVGKIPFLK